MKRYAAIIVWLAAALVGAQAFGATYYVSKINGSDANDGTSPSTPFNTLAAAQSVASSGDLILLHANCIWREGWSSPSGCHFARYGEGLDPAIDCTDVVTSWVLDGTNNYSASVTVETSANTREPMVFEDGVLMLRKTSEEAVESAEGSYFVTQADMSESPVEVFIHPTGGGNPTTNGKTYRVTTRVYGITGAASIKNVYARGAGYNDGSLRAYDHTTGGTLSGVEVYGGTKHHAFANDFVSVNCFDAMTETTTGAGIMCVAYQDDPTGLAATFTDVWAVQYNGDTDATGCGAFLAHGGGSGWTSVTYTRCGVAGPISTGYGGGQGSVTAIGCAALGTRDAFGGSSGADSFTCTDHQASLMFACNRSVCNAPTNTLDNAFIFYPSDGTAESNAIIRFGGATTFKNVTIYSTVTGAGTGRRFMEANAAASVAHNYCVFFGRPGSFYHVHAPTGVTLGASDFNIYFSLSEGGNGHAFRGLHGDTTYTTLASWQTATGQDANSVYLTAEQAADFFLGDPTKGDFRINPNAAVTGGDGTVYVGTFADGVTPITNAGAQVNINLPPAWKPVPVPRILTAEGDVDDSNAALAARLAELETLLTTGVIDANVVQISGDSTAADNLEAYTDGSTPMPVNATHFGGTAGTFSSGQPTVLISSGTGSGQIDLSGGGVPLRADQEVELSSEAQTAIAEASRDAVLGATLGDFTTAGTLGEALNWSKAAFAESGVLSEAALVNAPDSIDEQQVRDAIGLAEANLDEQLSGVTAGVTEPRVNFEPDPGFTFQISRRSDNTYKCTRALRLVAGAVETVHPAIDMTPLFARSNPVKTVGTPTISGGGITVEAEGPRDSYAMLKVSGTATAGERRTITVLVTMRSNAVVKVELDVEVLQ